MAPFNKVPFGAPLAVGVLPFTAGTYFFVDSNNGSDGNSGLKPHLAFATVQKAIDSTTLGLHDVIVLLPGHAETVTATNIAVNIAGTQIVGYGAGLKRPVFTYNAAGSTITVSKANCSWSGCDFVPTGTIDVAAAFTLTTAKDFTLSDNTFRDASSTSDFTSIVVGSATSLANDGLTFVRNSVWGLATSPNAVISILATCDRVLIADNYVVHAGTNNVGHFVTLSSFACRDFRLLRNMLSSAATEAAQAVGIMLTGSSSSSTGFVAGNFVAALRTTTPLLDTAGTGLRHFENYYTDVADKSGRLHPVISP